jgi:hypothetical protein
MKALFWQLAYKLYAVRSPSTGFELFAVGFGAFLVAAYILSAFLNPTMPNALRLVVAIALVIVGLAHRRIRLERKKGSNALYEKMLSAKT